MPGSCHAVSRDGNECQIVSKVLLEVRGWLPGHCYVIAMWLLWAYGWFPIYFYFDLVDMGVWVVTRELLCSCKGVVSGCQGVSLWSL